MPDHGSIQANVAAVQRRISYQERRSDFNLSLLDHMRAAHEGDLGECDVIAAFLEQPDARDLILRTTLDALEELFLTPIELRDAKLADRTNSERIAVLSVAVKHAASPRLLHATGGSELAI